MKDLWAMRGMGGVCKLFQEEGTVYTEAHVDDKEMIYFLKKCSGGNGLQKKNHGSFSLSGEEPHSWNR